MALVVFLQDYSSDSPQNWAPRTEDESQDLTGPVGTWLTGQVANLHEDELANLVDGGVVELVTP